METAKVFENGRSQAVRIPKEYRFSEDEVYIHKVGGIVMLIPKGERWSGFMRGLAMFTDDLFEDERQQGIQEERETL